VLESFKTLVMVMATAALVSDVVPSGALAQDLTLQEVREIAKEAYIYGFPMVDNYRVQYAYFQDPANPEYKAPRNNLFNIGLPPEKWSSLRYGF
jgi:hypothetical protein